MSFMLPEKTSSSRPSLIREVQERGAKIPGFISLAIGNPSAEAIPQAALKNAIKKVTSENLLRVFEYGPTGGSVGLMELTKQRLSEKKKLPKDRQAFIMLNGSGHGLGVAARTLCCEGDEVYFEQFSYPCAIYAVRAVGGKPVGIPVDKDGMIPEELEKQAKSGRGKYIYLNPNFQNPTGLTMPLQRRKEIYRIAGEYDLLIYEDDPYGDIRFSGTAVPNFKAIDTEGIVLFAGSYSKTLSPGLRVGYLYGEEKYIKPMEVIKNVMDGQSPLFNQLIVQYTLQAIDYEKHICRICELYKKRADAMIRALEQNGPSAVQFTRPEGGMFMWVTLPEYVDIDTFYEELFRQGVGAVKSEAFAVDGKKTGHAFRLNYTYAPIEQLIEGTTRFAKAARLFCRE